MTERLYEKDSYCREFEAKVIDCFQDGDYYKIVLDCTAFFPEGGGQAPDSGFLGETKVLDVQIENGMIFHKTEKPFNVGETVTGKIDWDLRFSRMQSHSGEHIVSGIVHKEFGYNNVGFHMSESVMTVDFDGPLSQEDINLIELKANRAVFENLSVLVSYPTDDELESIPYRSKIDIKDQIRIVTIGEVDCCACCAPHPSRTGEIGIIKILDFAPHKKGTRIEMIAGINAYNDYFAISASNKALMKLLSASRYSVLEAVEKQSDILKELKSENMKMSRSLALSNLQPEWTESSAVAFSENLSYDDLRYCSNALVEKGANACALFSKTDNGNYLYVLSSNGGDIRDTVKKLNEAFSGKGGGKPDYAQGQILSCDEDKIKEFLKGLL